MTEAERWNHIRDFANFLIGHSEDVLFHDDDGIWKLIDLRDCTIPGWGLITMEKVLEFFDECGVSQYLGGHMVLVRTNFNEHLRQVTQQCMEELRGV